MNRSRMILASSTAALMLFTGLETATPALAAPPAPPSTNACPWEPNVYSFTSVSTSLRPTNLYSAYITGPGTITYSQTTTATASASMTASVTAEASVVFTKASATLGVTVGASYSSSGGFSYTLSVPSGLRRRIRLFQSSRSFIVTKQYFSTGACRYYVSYSDRTNAPKKVRDDEWRLEA
jgi:hypothetical protein